MTERHYDITSLIKRDHTEIKHLFSRWESTKDDERFHIGHEFIRAVSVHSAAEEIILYGEFYQLPGGDKMRENSLQEHQKVKELLYELDSAKTAHDPQYEHSFRQVMKELNDHIKEEEEVVLPLFERHLSKERLRNLGSTFETTRSVVPTRPHPSAPTGRVSEAIVGFITKPIDALRDLARFSSVGKSATASSSESSSTSSILSSGTSTAPSMHHMGSTTGSLTTTPSTMSAHATTSSRALER